MRILLDHVHIVRTQRAYVYITVDILGECRTLLGEREQAIHRFNLYQRLFSEVSEHSTHRWRGM